MVYFVMEPQNVDKHFETLEQVKEYLKELRDSGDTMYESNLIIGKLIPKNR
ncbi:MAG: hypothetical protein K8E24_015195 [Methanobacterium paludis]|nr:hypothetical protein [Methanobacterium paludis]